MSWSRFLLSSICFSILFLALPVFAAGGDVFLSPAKQEVVMNPGEQRSVTVSIGNRSDTVVVLSVNVEDVGAGTDSKTAVIPLGERVPGESSLAPYTLLSTSSVTLAPHTNTVVEAQIALPPGVTPGGHYGALMFATSPQATVGSARVVTRLGALLFVRVNGDIKEEGAITRFSTRMGRRLLFTTDIPLVLEYRNTGNVHLNPYGVVRVTPWWGNHVRIFAVDPWYVLPGGTRSRDVFIPRVIIPGRYLITLELNRGYNDIVDIRTISVWVLPWQWLLGGVCILTVLGLWRYFVRMKTQ